MKTKIERPSTKVLKDGFEVLETGFGGAKEYDGVDNALREQGHCNDGANARNPKADETARAESQSSHLPQKQPGASGKKS
jgi:hypothetical protein